MKSLLASLFLLSGSVACAVPAFVNFADPGSPVTLTGFFKVDGTDYVTTSTAPLSTTASASFNGVYAVPTTPFSLSFSFTVTDDTLASTHQGAFTVTSNAPVPLPVSAHSLEFGVSGLFALDPSLVLSGFSFVSGDSAITSVAVSSYNATTGTMTFTNSAAFQIPPSASLAFTGNFTTSAVPEPSTWAGIFGLVVLGVAIYRRRA